VNGERDGNAERNHEEKHSTAMGDAAEHGLQPTAAGEIMSRRG